MKLTEKEKAIKAKRDALQRTINRVKSEFSFKKIKTYHDYLRSIGQEISGENRTLTLDDLKAELYKLHDNLEVELQKQEEPTVPAVPAVPAAETLKDYGIKPSPNENAFLYWFQKKACAELLDGILKHNNTGQYLFAKAGDGKTFILGAMLRRLIDMGWHKQNTMSPWPIIYVTKASAVIQTQRVLENEFGIDNNIVTVIGIDQLRARFGKMFIVEKLEIVGGEEIVTYQWKPLINPKLIIWDEGHALKNTTSVQHKIACSFNSLQGVYQVFSSATPYMRVSEAKCFVLSTKMRYKLGGLDVHVNERTWHDFATEVAMGDPEEYNKAAVDRLTTIMDKYIVRVKGVIPQFKAVNRVELINFVTPEGEKFYRSAYERFLIKKAKAEGKIAEGSGSRMEILVALLQFNIAAESCPDRARIVADRMYNAVEHHGKAAVCAMKFKISISKILKILMEEYHVPRSRISVIWGGSSGVNKSKKAQSKKALMSNQDLLAMLESQGITLEGLGLGEDVVLQEEVKFADDLKLTTQSKDQRQFEIDRFQKGITQYCFFTMRAGGVGLSLHHTDMLTKVKVRHKESGYSVEEDIPKIPTRQRILFSAPTYSAIDLVQTLGRCPRLTSLSDTEQFLLFFRDTVEEDVAAICENKLRCLSKVVRNRESWEQLLLENRRTIEDYKRQSVTEAITATEEDRELVTVGDSDIEEEEE